VNACEKGVSIGARQRCRKARVQISTTPSPLWNDMLLFFALPGEPKPKDNYFQTKDFDLLMDHYSITADLEKPSPQ